jgi:hypothetical protein
MSKRRSIGIRFLHITADLVESDDYERRKIEALLLPSEPLLVNESGSISADAAISAGSFHRGTVSTYAFNFLVISAQRYSLNQTFFASARKQCYRPHSGTCL